MLPSLQFRWLGVAGIELAFGDQILAVDPFFTRPPLRRFWFGRTSSNGELASGKLPHCDAILVTHPHYDHVMDVPGLAARTGAQVYGSANTCHLCTAAGLSPKQAHQLTAGDRLALGAFSVEVMPDQHMRLPVDWLVNGKLPDRLSFPLRLRAYRMDTYFAFRIETPVCRVSVGNGLVPADVLFSIPLRPWAELRNLLLVVKPRLLIPIHWDDFFSPLSQPIRPSLQADWRSFPPIKRMSLKKFKREMESLSPGMKVLVPEIFKTYDLGTLLTNKALP